MKPDDLEPLSESMRSLLDSERPLQPVPADVKARLFERLSTSIANVPGGSGSSGSGSGSAPRSDASTGSTPAGTGTAGAAKLAPGALGGAATAGKVVIGIVSFSLGGVVGAGIHAAATRNEPPAMVATSQPSAPPPARPDAPVPPGEQPSVAAPALAAVPSVDAQPGAAARPQQGPERGSQPSGTPTPSPAAPVSPGQPRPSDSLGAERSFIEQARAALARHDAAAALAALAQHQQAFPSGQLAEERLALQVMAMAQSGQLDRARELAQLFRAQHPDSLLLPAVEASVRNPGP